jgi:hypothetical protein
MANITSSLRWIAPAAALAALGACYSSYGQGSTDTQNRNLTGFDSIEASSGVNVELRQGPFAIKVEAPDDDMDAIKTELHGSTLKIYRDGMNSWFNWSSGRRLVTVTAPTYVSVRASSGADVEGANLTLDAISLDAGSGGDIEFSGACKLVKAEADSGGDVNAEDLKCENGEADASSGGDVDVFVTGTAKGEASSGGDVHFHGNPTSFTKDESSGGDVDASR